MGRLPAEGKKAKTTLSRDPLSIVRRTWRQLRGDAAEEQAARWLAGHGLRIVARQQRFRCGELDLVAWHGDTLVFIEVRRRQRGVDAAASIDSAKRGKIRRAALCYLARHHGRQAPACRFDAITIDALGHLDWHIAAFDGDGET
jgi:putative endonuclease